MVCYITHKLSSTLSSFEVTPSPPPALTEQNKPFSHTDRIFIDKQTHLRAFSTSNDKHISGNVIGEIQDNKRFITKADRVAQLIKMQVAICRL